ncbi:MAG: general secretion pathway protein GspK [Planctomycetes bacterium]|nr:general secretion pathway protein GspK [Planctomycetota bacterium]
MAKGSVRKAARSQRRGFALMVVLILVIMLAVLVYGLQSDVQREAAVSGNVRDDLRAAYLAQMALIRGQVILRLDKASDYDSLNEEWSKPLSWEGETWGDDGSSEGDRPKDPMVLISDEDRKFNLLMLVRGTEDQQKEAAEVLKRLIDICRRTDERLEGTSERLGEKILDGTPRNTRNLGEDSDVNTATLVSNLVKYLQERLTEESDELEFTATEDGDVRSMKKQTPYEMLTLGELLQVEGWTEKLLYGPVRKADAPIEKGSSDEPEEYRPWNELTDEERFEQTRAAVESADLRSRDPNPLGIIHYLTLYTSGRININTASRELLLALDADLTWDVVDQILTAREQDRQDVAEAEETGEIPVDEPPPEGEEEEEEDKASFRAQDIAAYAAFVTRVSGEQTEEGAAAPEIKDFTEEIFNRFKPWLTVRSTVYSVEASATAGKVTHSIRAVYRRTGSNQAAAPAAPAAGQPAPATPAAPAEGEAAEDGFPPEPKIKLTLLFRDVAIR